LKRVFHKLDAKFNAAEVAQPPILRTCRLIRQTFLSSWYQNNIFLAYDYTSLRRQIVHWLVAIGPLNRVDLNLYTEHDWTGVIGKMLKKEFKKIDDDRSLVCGSPARLGKIPYTHVTFEYQPKTDVELGYGLPSRSEPAEVILAEDEKKFEIYRADVTPKGRDPIMSLLEAEQYIFR
jgi:hypothetical protein